MHDNVPEPLQPASRRYPGVTVEDCDDEEPIPNVPKPKPVIDYFPYAGDAYPGDYPTAWEQKLAKDIDDESPPWGEFGSMEDREVAKWLTTSGVSQTEMNKFLKLTKVSLSSGLRLIAF